MKRKTFRLIHLYIGLVSGLIVFVEGMTGALWVFQDEIKALTKKELVITPQDIPIITPTQVKQFAEEAIPGKAIHGVLYQNQPAQPIEVIFYEENPEFYYSLFLDPYSGEVLEHEDHEEGFFAFMMDGHVNLWLPPAIGKNVVSYGTLLFLFSILTGIVLWWPKNKKGRKQRFTFDWKDSTRWRRKNFDLHTVVGFYISSLAMVFVITGLVMALNWFYFIYYSAMGGDSEMRFVIPNNHSKTQPALTQKPIDNLPQLLASSYPDAQDFEIHYPYADSVSIYVEVSYQDKVYYDADYVFFDQATLEEVPTPSIYGKYKDADVQDHIMRMNYDIHVGAILGLPGKILAFFASLIVASLPVTGILLWLGRKKKTVPAKLAMES